MDGETGRLVGRLAAVAVGTYNVNGGRGRYLNAYTVLTMRQYGEEHLGTKRQPDNSSSLKFRQRGLLLE